ncbi:MAG: adenylate/guanylate cyclase domain-containing protein [Bacteroidia bacterium]
MASNRSIRQYRLENALQYALIFQVFAMIFYLVYASLAPVEQPRHSLWDERLFGAGVFGFLAGLIEEAWLRKRTRKMPFAKALILKTLVFAFLIAITFPLLRLLGFWLGLNPFESSYLNQGSEAFLQHGLQVFIFYALVSLLSFGAMQISRLVGRGRLMFFLTGKYEHPSWEENILMFVDLKASTTIADSLNSARYSEFIKDYIDDLSEPIYTYQGRVHQYVGDEIIVYWPVASSKKKNNRPLHCFVGMLDIIEKNSKYYLEKYGELPRFKGGLHGGPMIVTEVGAIKKEIAFHGTVVNTTSRIQQKCNELNTNFLISEYILEHTELAPLYVPFLEGSFLLKGKTELMNLYSVEKAENAWRKGIKK